MTDAQTPREDRAKFEDGKTYKVETICARADAQSADYALRLLKRKLEMVAKHHGEGVTLDLCCATGGHLIDLAHVVSPAVGLDFSAPFIRKAAEDAAAAGLPDLAFLVGDAKALPFADDSIGTAYCLSSLYVIPDVQVVFRELARTLKPGARAVLDLGNARSLNAYSVRHYPDLAKQYFHTRAELRRMIAEAGLVIVEHRAFQILPLWADRPGWLRPLLHPGWKRVLGARLGGRMLDEWISNLPLLRSLAFRQMIVCEKPKGRT